MCSLFSLLSTKDLAIAQWKQKIRHVHVMEHMTALP